jgi:DNA-binding phage protein
LNTIQPERRKAVGTETITRLQTVINGSGMTMTAIAQKAGIRRETLYNRLAGKGEFTASEIVGLSTALKLNREQRDFIFCLGG